MTVGSVVTPVRIAPRGLIGDLKSPAGPAGLVIFAHGSGSSRLSPRNQQVADTLVDAGMAVLLFDLLTEDEARDRANVFDIDLLAERLVEAVDWARARAGLASLPIGLFGASTGAAAALKAATLRPDAVASVVSRGGRPDLAGEALVDVTAPTLLIVGERDEQVIGLNRTAQARLGGPSRLEIVPGATHLFEEPGALETVSRLARAWFANHLGRRPA